MSSYFDALAREVAELPEDDALFIEGVKQIEDRLFHDVSYITGDREFPEKFREQAMTILACKRMEVAGILNVRVRDYVLAVRSSRAVEDMHNLFHEVARSRTETRFGLLSDSPTGDAARRDEHDEDAGREPAEVVRKSSGTDDILVPDDDATLTWGDVTRVLSQFHLDYRDNRKTRPVTVISEISSELAKHARKEND